MSEFNIRVDELDEESESECSCCGRPIHEGEGILLSDEGELAYYGYRFTEGHETRFTLGVVAVELNGDIQPGMAVVSCHSDGESLIYTVQDPEASPWSSTETLGPVLTRNEILEDNVMPKLFSFVDSITAKDKRLATHILSSITED
ncbi:MAG: hypothetical protein NXI26_27465 [bacterium]|nr:hypothetical protein [bacterium]